MSLNRTMSARRKRRSGRRHSPMRWLLLLAVAGMLAGGGLIWRMWFGINDRLYYTQIVHAAHRHGLDPELVRAVIWRESRFDSRAVGKAGEIGLMQILPNGAVAEWSRVMRRPVPPDWQLFRPEVNLEIGCFYLARALRRWDGYRCATELALCQYNAGERRAQRWRPEDPQEADMTDRITIRSTREYVRSIMKRYQRYRQERERSRQ